MGTDNDFTEIESQSRATNPTATPVATVKFIEQIRHNAGRNADTIILHGGLHETVGGELGGYVDFFGIAAVLDGVVDQITDDFVHTDVINGHQWQVGRDSNIDGNVMHGSSKPHIAHCSFYNVTPVFLVQFERELVVVDTGDIEDVVHKSHELLGTGIHFVHKVSQFVLGV